MYLQDFASKLGLNIHYNSEIVSIAREKNSRDNKAEIFMLKDRNDTLYRCEILIIRYCLYMPYCTNFIFRQIFDSTGMWVPNIPEKFSGIELAEVHKFHTRYHMI